MAVVLYAKGEEVMWKRKVKFSRCLGGEDNDG